MSKENNAYYSKTRKNLLSEIAILQEDLVKYKEVYDTMVEVFARVGEDGCFEMLSPSVFEVFGYREEELIGKKAIDCCVDPFDLDCMMELIKEKGYCKNIESRVYSKQGQIKLISINAKPYVDKHGNKIAIDCLIRDNTDQNNAEEEIKLNNWLLEESEKIAHLGHLSWDTQTSKIYWSNEVYRICGVDFSVTPSLRSTLSLVHPEDLNYVRMNLKLALKGVKDFNLDHRIIRQDNGELKWVQVQMQLKFTADGNLKSLLCTVLDITDKKNDQNALFQSEEEFRSIYENTYSGIHLVDVNGKFLKANHRFVELLGYSESELLNMRMPDITHPDDQSEINDKLAALISGEISHFEAEQRYITKSGEELICNMAVTAPIGINGMPEFLTASLTDITEEKRIREILEGISEIQSTFIGESISKNIFKKILHTLMIITKSSVGCISEAQFQDGKMTLLSHGYMALGKERSLETLSEESKVQKLEELASIVLSNKVSFLCNTAQTSEMSGDALNGIENFMGLPFYHNSELVGIIGVANKKNGYNDDNVRLLKPFVATCATLIKAYKNEITRSEEQQAAKRMQEVFTQELEMKVAERTEDLQRTKMELSISLEKEKILGDLKSQFVSTASHQFRTPLTIIQSNMAILDLQKDLMSDAFKPIFEKVNCRIVSQISRMTEMINNVLILGKIDSGSIVPEFQLVDLIGLCSEIIDNYNEIQEDQRRMNLIVVGEPYPIELDAKLVTHAISNFVSNAFKYSYNRPAPQMNIFFDTQSTKVSIMDFGLGIPKEDLTNLFEPFYRATNVTEVSGTGLGTTIAKEYVELNGGSIEVKSNLNQGSEFILTFKPLS